MIEISKLENAGFYPSFESMRNPKNSWDRSDSHFYFDEDLGNYTFSIGENDLNLALKLAKNGPVHAKYRRMIAVWSNITAPLYWWKEFETYRAGVIPNPFDIEMNSCSTMHKLMDKEFELSDFSHDHLTDDYSIDECLFTSPEELFKQTIYYLNSLRSRYLSTKDKKYWYATVQLLPTSYNQKRTIMFNYEALAHIYQDRKNHKLDEWKDLCKWIEMLPYSELITLKENDEKKEND